jgi:cytochrome o ubiquinol oxidase subunit I
MKEHKAAVHHGSYVDIALPKGSSVGLLIALFAFVFGFSMVWHIWWVLPISLAGIFFTILLRSFSDDTEYIVPIALVQATETRHQHSL